MAFVLAHLSDAHIGPLPKPRRRDLIGKRLTGYINWQRGRHRIHNMDALGLLVEDIKAQAPDHIAMTGDVMNLGLPEEYPIAAAWLRTLGAPEDVSFVPGNHDAYTRGSMPHLARTFGPWTSGGKDLPASYPYLRVRGDVALIGVSSGIPTAPFIASGRLGPAQLLSLETLLKQAGADGLCRVIMIHHPPTLTGATPGRSLTDAKDFEAVVARAGAELILHGHNHRLSVTHIDGAGKQVPVVGVVSASMMGHNTLHRAAYHLFEIERAGAGFQINARVRGMHPVTDAMDELRPLDLG